MSEYCCEELHRTIKAREAAINGDGSVDLGSDSDIFWDLPYCPWCGTKLLKETTDG